MQKCVSEEMCAWSPGAPGTCNSHDEVFRRHTPDPACMVTGQPPGFSGGGMAPIQRGVSSTREEPHGGALVRRQLVFISF